MPDIADLACPEVKIHLFQLFQYPLRRIDLIRTHDLQHLMVLRTIQYHIVRRHLMSHGDAQHGISKFLPIPHDGIILFALPMERKILVEGLRRSIRHIFDVVRRNRDQDLQGGIDIPILVLAGILLHLIECLIDIMGILLLLNLQDGQPIDQKRRVKTAILLAGDLGRTLYLIHHLIDGIACADLSLVEYGQIDMASIIQVDFELGHAIKSIEELPRLIGRCNIRNLSLYLIELHYAQRMLQRALVMTFEDFLEILPKLFGRLNLRLIAPELRLDTVFADRFFGLQALSCPFCHRYRPQCQILYQLCFKLCFPHRLLASANFAIKTIFSPSAARFFSAVKCSCCK